MKSSLAPETKVAAAGIAGAASIVLVWVASQFGVDLPPEVASSVTALVAFAAGYFKKS